MRILWWHVAPSLTPLLLAVAVPRVGSAILLGASLGFLGLGLPPEVPEWGAMVRTGMSYPRLGAHHVVLFPGLAIVATVLGLNLIADHLDTLQRTRVRPGRRTVEAFTGEATLFALRRTAGATLLVGRLIGGRRERPRPDGPGA